MKFGILNKSGQQTMFKIFKNCKLLFQSSPIFFIGRFKRIRRNKNKIL